MLFTTLAPILIKILLLSCVNLANKLIFKLIQISPTRIYKWSLYFNNSINNSVWWLNSGCKHTWVKMFWWNIADVSMVSVSIYQKTVFIRTGKKSTSSIPLIWSFTECCTWVVHISTISNLITDMEKSDNKLKERSCIHLFCRDLSTPTPCFKSFILSSHCSFYHYKRF